MRTLKYLNFNKSLLLVFVFYFFFSLSFVKAATLSFSSLSGNYAKDTLINIDVLVSNPDKVARSVSGLISFPKDLISVTSLSKNGSIVDSWIQEPTFYNSSGNINFEGLFSNPGYSGKSDKILTITFKILSATGTVNINFISGSVLDIKDISKNLLVHSSGFSFNISEAVPKDKIEISKQSITEGIYSKFTNKIYDWLSFILASLMSLLNLIISNTSKFYIAASFGLLSLYSLILSGTKGLFSIISSSILGSVHLIIDIAQSFYLAVITIILGLISVIKLIHILIIIIILMVLLLWYMRYKIFKITKTMKKEVSEADSALREAFNILKESEKEQIEVLDKAKSKRKSTKEDKIKRQFKKDLTDAETYVKKEIEDINKLVE